MKGTWQTTSGGSGAGTAAVAIGAAVAAAAIAGPVIRAAVSLVETVLIVAGGLLALTVVAAVVFLVYRLRGGSLIVPRHAPWTATQVPTGRPMSTVTGDTVRAAISTPVVPVHNHFHIHLAGQDAEADAATVRALIERTR